MNIPRFNSIKDLPPTAFVLSMNINGDNLWDFDENFLPVFSQKLKTWLDKTNIEAELFHSFVENSFEVLIEFSNTNDATLFKLTWSDYIVTTIYHELLQ